MYPSFYSFIHKNSALGFRKHRTVIRCSSERKVTTAITLLSQAFNSAHFATTLCKFFIDR
jgi:hypothetical protein